jgi:hypothetical protein
VGPGANCESLGIAFFFWGKHLKALNFGELCGKSLGIYSAYINYFKNK